MDSMTNIITGLIWRPTAIIISPIEYPIIPCCSKLIAGFSTGIKGPRKVCLAACQQSIRHGNHKNIALSDHVDVRCQRTRQGPNSGKTCWQFVRDPRLNPGVDYGPELKLRYVQLCIYCWLAKKTCHNSAYSTIPHHGGSIPQANIGRHFSRE